MSNKILKGLNLEALGLEGTYMVPQVDETLSKSGDSADAKVVGDTLNSKMPLGGTVVLPEPLCISGGEVVNFCNNLRIGHMVEGEEGVYFEGYFNDEKEQGILSLMGTYNDEPVELWGVAESDNLYSATNKKYVDTNFMRIIAETNLNMNNQGIMNVNLLDFSSMESNNGYISLYAKGDPDDDNNPEVLELDSVNGNPLIRGVGDPIKAYDVATKGYVDETQPFKATTASNLTIDGKYTMVSVNNLDAAGTISADDDLVFNGGDEPRSLKDMYNRLELAENKIAYPIINAIGTDDPATYFENLGITPVRGQVYIQLPPSTTEGGEE